MNKVVVTGANGFVGGAVCKALDAKGIEILAIVKDETLPLGDLDGLKHVRIVYCDLEQIRHLDELVSDRDFDCFYHFAWVGSAGPLRGDYQVQLKNVEYTCDSIIAAKSVGCKRFIFAASIMEYEVMKLMATDRPIGINTLYSTSKITAEYMARAVADQQGLEYIGGIISNIYGPGEMSPRLVNTTIRKLLTGEHCAFSAGEQMYDFIYRDDAAQAFIALGEKAKAGKSYYIGSGNPHKLRDFLEELGQVVAPDAVLGFGEIPFDGVTLTYQEFDVNALQNDTGFRPAVTFAQGIQNTMEWIRESGAGK